MCPPPLVEIGLTDLLATGMTSALMFIPSFPVLWNICLKYSRVSNKLTALLNRDANKCTIKEFRVAGVHQSEHGHTREKFICYQKLSIFFYISIIQNLQYGQLMITPCTNLYSFCSISPGKTSQKMDI